MAGHGIGAASAALAAIDGGARLWDDGGLWRTPSTASLYQWKWPLRVAAWLTFPLGTAALAVALWPDPVPAVVQWLPLTMLLAIVGVLAAAVVFEGSHATAKRRAEGPWWWRLAGAPLDSAAAKDLVTRTIWQLVRGGDQADHPEASKAGHRYAEVLAEGLGQPGFRELMLIATDMDARRDVVAAMLREPYRRDFMVSKGERDRRSEVLDLAGLGREHALDIAGGAMTPPGCEPHLVTFGVESFWRGETHRLCNRAGSVSRLLEELAAAGVSQAVIVSAVAAPAVPHRLSVPRLDLRHRLGDAIAAAESASLRDAMEMARLRFDSLYLICPAHNPVGAFDFSGAYDEASDRRQEIQELMERAYEDAYRQFIEPVVGASGEHLARQGAGDLDVSGGQAYVTGILDDGDPSR